jgi:hypothetical protein
MSNIGRPPAGISENGTPECTSRYPKLTVYLRPAVKTRLEALSILADEPAWKILDIAFQNHFDSLPMEDKTAIEGLIQLKEQKRVRAQQQRAKDNGSLPLAKVAAV